MYIDIPRSAAERRDYEAEEDAQTLLRAKQVNADPERKAKAKAIMRDAQKVLNDAAKGVIPTGKEKNPATIGKLNVPMMAKR